jgi:PAS domain S-box-containing protein
MERTFDRWLIGAGGLVALLIAAAVLTYQNTRQLHHDAERVAQSHEVMTGLENLLSLAKDAETGQRGYLITGEARYLEPYNAAVAAINKQVDDVERLTADTPRQQARFPELRKCLSAKLKELEQTIALRKREGFDAAQKEVLTDRGKKEMDALRVVVEEMTQHEEGLLRERAAKAKQTYRWAIVTGLLSGVAAVAGVVAFMVLLRRHLAARAAAAAVVAEQAVLLRTTLASIGDGVITTDDKGRITAMNAVAELLTGWDREQALGLPLDGVFRIVNEQTQQPVENPAARALKEGVIVGLANHTILIAKDGTERPIDDSAAPIRYEGGDVVGCVLVFRDVTERRQVEQQIRQQAASLAEADRRKDEFLATLAHELRNPLAPIRNALSILHVASDNREMLDRAREMMTRQVGQMVRLIDDLLDVSRISRGKLQLRKQRVELAPVINQAVEACRPLAESAGHEMTISLPPQPVYLNADPIRLTQVISNLLDNACKFTQHAGRIRLTAERQGGDVVVAVKDNGIGIPPDRIDGIFELFAQVDRTLEKSHGGLGIGLTLVKRLVEMHGGTVEVHSEGQGKGSDFLVRLPVVVEQPLPSSEGSADEIRPSGPRRILVVDDNRDNAESLAMLFGLNGNEMHMAYDGEQAVEVASKVRPDVILLDIGLPRLNGYDVCRRIREERWAKHTVIIALTGWGQEDYRRRSTDAGFNGHLVKPVNHAVLAKLMAELLEAKTGQDSSGG